MGALYIVAVIIQLVHYVNGATKIDHYQLHADLFTNYNQEIRPVADDSEVMPVAVDFTLISISELKEKDQTLVSFGYLNVLWEDDFLSWNESEYNDLSNIVVPQKMVWRPDIVVGNSVESRSEIGFDEMPIRLNSIGYIEWEPSILFQTSCDIDISYYPFDTQQCTIVLETMVSRQDELNLIINDQNVILTDYSPNGQWQLLETSMVKKDKIGKTAIHINLKIQRRRTFYILNLILPIALLSTMGSLTFALPCDAGEKMSLSITVLLAYVVFLTIISDSMPQTSLQISYLGVYLTLLISLSVMAVLLSVPVLRLHHSNPSEPVHSIFVWFVRRFGKCRCRKVADIQKADVETFASPKTQNFIKDECKVTWQDVSKAIDKLFWRVTISITILSTIVFLAAMLAV